MEETIEIEGHKALVSFDAELGMLRGEFTGLSGAADFYAETAEKLRAEGQLSLRIYFDVCRENGIAPVHNPACD